MDNNKVVWAMCVLMPMFCDSMISPVVLSKFGNLTRLFLTPLRGFKRGHQSRT